MINPRNAIVGGLRLLWNWYPLLGLIGFAVTGVAFALGTVSILVPLSFWLVMAVWVWLRFRATDPARRRVDREGNDPKL